MISPEELALGPGNGPDFRGLGFVDWLNYWTNAIDNIVD